MDHPLGIIAGTGFYALDDLTEVDTGDITTDYGDARITTGRWHDLSVAFLTRHGTGHSVPPHMVNYRANIAALAQIGCQDVIAVSVTGGISDRAAPGALFCLDDFIDFTHGRPPTFHDGSGPEGVVHIDVVRAYHPDLRSEIMTAAHASEIDIIDGGVYACFQGPRFETPAEIRLAALAGADVAGMTGCPEVTLAVEAGLRYAGISVVVNAAAGLADEELTMDEIVATSKRNSVSVLTILDRFVRNRQADR